MQSWPRDKHISVRYEDLCQNTDQSLEKILKFLDVQTDLKILDYKNMVQHVVGNPIRLKPLAEIKIDERWKSELSTNKLIQINNIAGKMNQKYGYEED